MIPSTPVMLTIVSLLRVEIVAILLSTLFVILVVYYFIVKTPAQQSKTPRFRKRDKVMFYGRKIIRRVDKIRKKQLLKFTLGRWRGEAKLPYGYIVREDVARPNGSDFSTIAIVSNSNEVPIDGFCRELHLALTAIGSALHLNRVKVTRQLGESMLDEANETQLSSWLQEQEEVNRIVIYQCDTSLTPWTITCLKQADCVLIVANADLTPSVGPVEEKLDVLSEKVPKELVLLHRCDAEKPEGTVEWLEIRPWCSFHHHIRCPQRMFVRKISRIHDIYTELKPTNMTNDNDFARLARFMTGTTIGLVLGGGGARGAAHPGIIRAIRESGIPIDMVGGVSIGAFVGALYAQETDPARVTQLSREWSIKMTTYWRQIIDLTYPVTAMFSGAAFNKTIHDFFGERQIEDLWLPYFTVTTDITHSKPRIHRHGSLWRYVRSSMSLSGYLPPLCDPNDGHLLLDGGYVNNLPADVMHDVMGAQTILAIDVGSQEDTEFTNYGDRLNGWWLLWNRWNPFGQNLKVPSLPEIQSRLAYVSCVRHLEEVKTSDYCTYIRPPIDQFKSFQFKSFDDIYEIGFSYGTAIFNAMNNTSIKNNGKGSIPRKNKDNIKS